MSMQTCCRDVRKMRQVVDQIKMLANNLEELRAEINTLKNNFPKDDDDPKNHSKRTKELKGDVFNKLKKYAKKITRVKLIKSRQVSRNNHEIHQPCTNFDPPISSILNYILRIGKRGETWQIPTRINYVKNEASQTDRKSRDQQKSHTSKRMDSIENILYSDTPILRYERKRYDKIMYPRKRATFVPRSSEISCELDSQVENSTSFPSTSISNILPSSWTAETKSDFKAFPQNVDMFSLGSNNKRFTTVSTQTKMAKVRQKHRNQNFHSKHPHLYFSKIKNAVITKGLTGNLKDSTFAACKKVNCVRDYPYLRREYYEKYVCNKKGRNNATEMIDYETTDKRFSSDKRSQRLNIVSAVNDDAVLQNVYSEEEQELCSSSSVSVDLEVNVSTGFNKLDESSQRRKPRTYVISKTTQNQNNWLKQYEKSVYYVGPTSDLTLSSHSFSNSNIFYN